jgi:hypothetical protein
MIWPPVAAQLGAHFFFEAADDGADLSGFSLPLSRIGSAVGTCKLKRRNARAAGLGEQTYRLHAVPDLAAAATLPATKNPSKETPPEFFVRTYIARALGVRGDFEAPGTC